MDWIADPSRWVQGFVAGMTTTAFLLVSVPMVITLFWNLVRRRRRRQKYLAMKNGERCGGGIKGCPGGMHCTSSHK